MHPKTIAHLQATIKRTTIEDKASRFCKEVVDFLEAGEYDEDLAKRIDIIVQCP